MVGSVMIVSYETLRNLMVYLRGTPVGLLLCDEGHRLKNGGQSAGKYLVLRTLKYFRITNISRTERVERQAPCYSDWNTYPGLWLLGHASPPNTILFRTI